MIPRTRLAALLVLPSLASPFLHAQDPAQDPAQYPAQGPGLEGQAQEYQGENPDRYAMVRALDGDVRITKGDVQDDLQKGTPVGEGDVVESSGRGVLQLADGTRIGFDRGARFTVASLFKDENGTRQVLLRLDRGRLRVKLDGDSDARVRVDTPSGSVACSDRATFKVDVDGDGVARISVTSGHVRVSDRRDDASLGAGEQISVFGPEDRLDRIRAFNTYDTDGFDRWCDGAWEVRRGESWDRVPAELRYYSDDLDSHGSWVYSDEYGWVWKPTGVAQDWRPYYQGRWAAYPGGMTWISYDPWAYVTYHHGRWAWSVGLGWTWIPGVYYSPAWVAWSYWDGYCGWAPLGYYNAPCTWGYGAWGGGYCWNVVNVSYINVRYVNRYCAYDRNILYGFNRGTGASSWTPNRGLGAPWRTRPLMASATEFRNPAREFNRAFQPSVERQRFAAYQQRASSAGRQIYFRPAGNTGIVPPDRQGRASAPGRVPFEDRRPLDRGPQGRPGNTGIVPPDRGGRPAPAPDRGVNGGIVPPGRGNTDRGNPERGNPGRPMPVPDRGVRPAPVPDRGVNGGIVPPDRRPAPDRRPSPAPDRSFDRDMDRPAPRREAPPMPQPPRREAPPREAPPRMENRPEPGRPEPSRPMPSRPEPSRPEPSRVEPPRGNPGGGSRGGGAPWRR